MKCKSLLVGATLLLAAGAGMTQQPPKPGAFREDVIKADEPSSQKDFNDFRKLVMGSEDAPEGERRKEVTNLFSRWLIYRLTWPKIQAGLDPKTTIDDVMTGSGLYIDGIFKAIVNPTSSISSDPDEARKTQRRREFQIELRKVMLPMVREVLQTQPIIARINGARVLHRWVELGHLEVMDDVLKLLEDANEHDAVKHWAVLSVTDAFGQAPSTYVGRDAGGKEVKRFDPDRATLAVWRFLDAHCKLPPTLVADMSQEAQNGIRFVRRFAIRALGASHRPLVIDTKDKREGPVAGLLATILANAENTVSPAASWEERVEAGVAICRLQPKLSTSYQPDVMLFQLATFATFLNAKANEDGDRTSQRWRHYATILSDGLKPLASELPANSPALAYYKKVAPMIDQVMVNVFDKDKNTQAVGDLSRWLQDPANAPKATSLYVPPLP